MPDYESPEISPHVEVDTHRSQWISYDAYGRPTKSITQNKVDTNFDIIGEFELSNETFVCLLSKRRILAGVYIRVLNPVDNQYEYWIAGIVYFKRPLVDILPEPLSKRPMLQIDRVAVTPGMESFHLASALYQYIIDIGCVLISDKEQFIGGMRLWKRLARLSQNEYSVYVYNRSQHEYMSKDNVPIAYNSHNIIDSEIWQYGLVGRNILLIAHK